MNDIESCYNQFVDVFDSFRFQNEDLVYDIFGDISAAVENANIMLIVGLPSMYDALVRVHEDVPYIIFNMLSFANYISQGHDLQGLARNLITHELIHVLIDQKYPAVQLDYKGYLDYISFHEGFAHVLSYKDDICQYQLDESYKQRFDNAKSKLANALTQTNQKLQDKYSLEANTGKFWDKFASVSSMLYLMKHIESLKNIYDEGWQGYTRKIIEYLWE
ncbi:MAG: hypothetical protein FWC67_03055 [Defluviitaleaceae bacterium]|nr:hypothetical protein [Defluviitaleaceae bacterium]